jgi:hypothetical protein
MSDVGARIAGFLQASATTDPRSSLRSTTRRSEIAADSPPASAPPAATDRAAAESGASHH